MKAKECKARFEALVSDRKIPEEIWELIERFIMPLRGGKFFQPLHAEGEIIWRRREIYDDTAMGGVDTLAASIHGSLTSPAAKWFDLQFQDPDLNQGEPKQWLDKASNQCWNAIQESNFNDEVAEGYLDLSGFGNACMSLEPVDDLTWKGIAFNSVPLRQCYFEEDADGDIVNFYRLFQWRPVAIVAKFGDDTPEKIRNMAENQSVQERIDVIFCVHPIKKNKDANVFGALNKDARPFGYKYILRDDSSVIEEGSFYEFPAHFLRWRNTAGSQWGYGPGHLALPTVLTLNELVKLVLESAEKVVDPAMLQQARGVLSDIDLSPGGLTTVKDPKTSLVPFESHARFDVSALQITDLRQIVRRMFHVDQLELKESPAMSATEVMVRYELMNRLLGPTMGRLQNDWLDPVVTKTFQIMFRMKQFDEMPNELENADFKIEYVGPLSRAQKSDDVAAMERWLANLGQLSEVWPDMRHVPNAIKIAQNMAEDLNIDSNLLHTPSQITTITRLEDQVAALQQQLELQQQQGEADQATGAARQLEAVP